MSFYFARLETRNFEFYAFAESPEECHELLKARWQIHVEQTEAWLEWSDLENDVIIEEIQMNSAHRR